MYGLGLLRLFHNRNDEFVPGAIYLYIDQKRHFLRSIIRKHEADYRFFHSEYFWVTHNRQALAHRHTFLARTETTLFNYEGDNRYISGGHASVGIPGISW